MDIDKIEKFINKYQLFMCMDIDKKELLRINKGFGGNLRNDSSIDFAIHKFQNKKMGFYKKLAYLWRAILVDHPFSDGNKRTAAYISIKLGVENKKQIDQDMLSYQLTSVAKQNITDINKIEWRIKNAIK
jgi:prophage maintenance system killer protein